MCARGCQCVCVCVQSSFMDLVGSHPFSTFYYHFLRGGCRGAPSKALPCIPLVCAWAPSWAAGGTFTSFSSSFHLVLHHFLVSDVAVQDPSPTRIISSCSCCVCHSFGLAYMVPKSHHLSLEESACTSVCVCVYTLILNSKLRVLAMTCGFQSVSSTRDFNLFRKQGAAGSPQFCCQRRRLWILRETDWDANLCTCKSAAHFGGSWQWG